MLRVPSKKNPGTFHFGGLGTGFFVSKFGLFLTAKHVVEEHMEFQNGNGLEAWVVVAGECFGSPIRDLVLHETADIALGGIAPPRRNDRPVPGFGISLTRIDSARPDIGEKLFTYGYPRTELSREEDVLGGTVKIDMNPDYYDGVLIEHHPEGVSICRWPIYRHSVPIASGLSGGPLLRKATGAAIGINCTGDSTHHEDVEHGTATDIALALDMKIGAPIQDYQSKPLRELLKSEDMILA
jgi:hypothetical protein